MLERYEIRERIGAGGLADVFAARDTARDREVALKMLREVTRDGAHVRRFLREGRLLQALRHNRLPRCYEVIDGERPTLVLERLRGASLSQTIRASGRLRPERADQIAIALLEALAFLHANGIVHRDVKAGNVYLERDGRILLMDLGLAVDPTDVLTTTLGDVIGTYAYMAPEQIAGAEVDHRCDLYSLGVTLYESLAGRRPFRAEGASGYLEAHLQGSARPLAEVAPDGTPPRLMHLIERLMARDPADRPYSARVALALLTGQSLHDELCEPPLVGRSGVLGSVEAVLDAGGVVHIVGEPGMGLGRCARLAWSRARERRMEVLSLRCGRVKDEAGLWEGLSRALRPTLGRVLPREDRVRSALAGLVGEAMPLLMVEDIDALPPAALKRLRALLEATAVCAVTTGGSPPDVPGHVVRLRPITEDETRALVAGMLATRAAPTELVSGLHTFTGGLPAVVVATLRDLHRRGALRWLGLDADGRQVWRLVRTEWVTGAHPLLRGFRATMSALRDDERALLEVLAVADEPVPLSAALAAAGLEEGTTAPFRLSRRRLVDELERPAPAGRGLGGLFGGPPPTVSWLAVSRPVVGAMARVELEAARLRALHGALARALDDMPDGPWRDERLPYHQALSVPPEQAGQALVGLGDWLAQQQRYRRSLAVLEQVLTGPISTKMDTLTATHGALTRGICLSALGRVVEARDSLAAARRLADELVRPDLAAATVLARGELQVLHGAVGRALELAEEAMSGSSDSVHDPVMPAAMALRAEALRLTGHSGAAGESFRNAMDVALVQGRMRVAARAQLGLARLSLARGATTQAGHDLEGATELMRSTGDGDGLLQCCYELASLHRDRGQVALALENASRVEVIAASTERPHGRAWGSVARAGIHLACGDLAGAARLLRSEQLAPETERPLRMAWMETLAELRLTRGDRPAALAVHQRALLEAETAGWFVHRAFHGGMVAILTAQGTELSEALSQLYEVDDRRRAARLLLEGARMTADVEILAEALAEIRALEDTVLLMRALHLTGGAPAREEIRLLADRMSAHAPRPLKETIEALAAVTWAR